MCNPLTVNVNTATSPRINLLESIQFKIGQTEIVPSPHCKSLGVIFDKNFSMQSQISAVCRSTHFHLRNIGTIRPLITESAAAQLVHSLVSSRLDYCNALLYGIPSSQLYRLQRIQNIAARIVTCTPKYAHITPVLKNLHWLPIEARIVFKILLLTYRCLNGMAPTYLCELITPYSPNRSLRSGSHHLLKIPRYKLETYGKRSFSVCAPSL